MEDLLRASSQFRAIIAIVVTVLIILLLISRIMLFKKAGQGWWKALIPIYGSFIYQKIATGNGWHLFLRTLTPLAVFFVPYTRLMLVSNFGGDTKLQALSMAFPRITELMLAFGKFEYIGSSTSSKKNNKKKESELEYHENDSEPEQTQSNGVEYMYDEEGKAYYYDEEDGEYYYVD